jgi:hypothetical protein
MLKQCPTDATNERTYATNEDRTHLKHESSVLKRARAEAMSLAPWWMDLSCPEVTYDDLERIRGVLADREAWYETVSEAHDARAAAGLFPDWNTSREWYHQLPVETPARGQQIAWARRELAALRRDLRTTPARKPTPKKPAPRQPAPPVIPPDRQLQIALAALDAQSGAAEPEWGVA